MVPHAPIPPCWSPRVSRSTNNNSYKFQRGDDDDDDGCDDGCDDINDDDDDDRC
jgi:hypothetical protein